MRTVRDMLPGGNQCIPITNLSFGWGGGHLVNAFHMMESSKALTFVLWKYVVGFYPAIEDKLWFLWKQSNIEFYIVFSSIFLQKDRFCL